MYKVRESDCLYFCARHESKLYYCRVLQLSSISPALLLFKFIACLHIVILLLTFNKLNFCATIFWNSGKCTDDYLWSKWFLLSTGSRAQFIVGKVVSSLGKHSTFWFLPSATTDEDASLERFPTWQRY